MVALTHTAVRGTLGVWHSGSVGLGPAVTVISKINILVKRPPHNKLTYEFVNTIQYKYAITMYANLNILRSFNPDIHVHLTKKSENTSHTNKYQLAVLTLHEGCWPLKHQSGTRGRGWSCWCGDWSRPARLEQTQLHAANDRPERRLVPWQAQGCQWLAGRRGPPRHPASRTVLRGQGEIV